MTGALLAFDVGTKRIGVAKAESSPAIAFALCTIDAGGDVQKSLQQIVSENKPSLFVVGLPRSQSGHESEQSDYSRKWSERYLQEFTVPIVFHDESTTSLLARERLEEQGIPFKREDIDATAAQIILESYMREIGA